MNIGVGCMQNNYSQKIRVIVGHIETWLVILSALSQVPCYQNAYTIPLILEIGSEFQSSNWGGCFRNVDYGHVRNILISGFLIMKTS
jgi:hypothetical protein